MSLDEKQSIRLATQISNVLGPEILLPIAFLLSVALSNFQYTTEIKWLFVIIIANLAIPSFWLWWLCRQGFVIDDTLENRELHKRRVIALIPLFCVIVAEMVMAWWLGSPQPITASLVAAILVMLMTGIVSFFWKISAHATGVSTFLTYIIILLGAWSAIGLFLIPLVAWARITLHRHTFAQLVVGALLAPILILIVFSMYNLIPPTASIIEFTR